MLYVILGGIDEDASGSEYETDTDEEGTEADGSPKRRRKKSQYQCCYKCLKFCSV